MAKVRFEWNKRELDRIVSSIDYSDEAIEYTCPQCGTAFHPSNGKIVCPRCGLIFLPPGQRTETP